MTTFTDEIRETVSPHKFGGSRRAAACYLLSLDSSCYDEASGDFEAPTGWFARFGRTILYTNSQGFVWDVRFPRESDARRVFAELDKEYAAWDDNPEDYDGF